MILLVALLAVMAAAFAAQASALARRLKETRTALDAALRRPAPPPPPSRVECRRERYGLLWFPVLTVDDASREVVGAVAGLPHCARCVRPLALAPGKVEEWFCATCDERRPASAVDLLTTDAVLADCLSEHFARHPEHRAAAGLSAPRVSRPEPVAA